MNGTCKLCGNVAQLCNSHIVPEFCYLAAYDNLHRAKKFQAEPSGEKLLQKGIREHLLCKKCETFLSKIENAFKKYWYGTPALPAVITTPEAAIVGFDYKTFKLFHLLILWRASVATTQDFNTVSLGPYENKVRQILLSGDPGPEEHYPMYGQVLIKDRAGHVAYGIVGKPQRSRFDEATVYYVAYSGCEWVTIVTEKPTPEEAALLPFAPTKAGTMLLAVVPVELSNTSRVFAQQRASAHRRR
jgi:hypothetical protein